MKKILFFLFAVTLVFNAGAATQFHSAKPVKNDSKQLVKHLQQTKTDRERAELLYRFKSSQKKQTISRAKKVAKAPQSKQDASDVTIERVTFIYNAAEGKIYYGLHTDTDVSFYFHIILADGQHDVELGKTYTLDDMNPEMSEWDSFDENDDIIQHFYQEASFTKTIGEGFNVSITAIVTDLDGNTWNLKYAEDPIVLAGETIKVEISKPLDYEYLDSDGTWLVRAQDNNAYVALRYFSNNTESPAGKFDGSDFDLSSTYIELPDGLDEWDDPVYKSLYAKDTKGEITDVDGTINVNATIIAEDGNVYDITMFFALPKAETKADMTSKNLTVDDWALDLWGELELFASDENGVSLGLDLFPDDVDNIFVTYTISPDGYGNNGYISVDGDQFNIYSGSITISWVDDKYVVTGTVLAWNNVEYTLNLTTPDPTITQLTFTAENLILDIFDDGWQISGFDDAHEEFITLASNQAIDKSSFTTDDLVYYYTYIMTADESFYLPIEADLTIKYADGIATVTGTFVTVNEDDEYDWREYTLNLVAKPYQPSERNITLKDFAFGYYAEGPDVYYELLSEDEQQKFCFDILVEQWSPDIVFGKTYNITDMLEDNTYGINQYENAYIIYETVSFTKSKSDDDNVSIVITITDTRGNTWNLTYTGSDKKTDPISVELGQCNHFNFDMDAVEYEMIDKDNTLACHLIFVFAEGEDDVVSDSTYTTATIDLERSYLSIRRTEYKITDATFYKEVYGDAQSVSASVTDERGFVFNLSFYDDGFKLTGDTIEIRLKETVEAIYLEDYEEWIIHAENESQIVHFDIYLDNEESPVGTFTDEVSVYSSRVEFILDAEENNWAYISLHSVDFVTISKEDDNYRIEAIVIGEDGNVYDILVSSDISGFETINAEESTAIKRFENGRLIIIRDNKRYDVMGRIQ